MDERFEILDAFVDGELVDPSDVKRALSEPEGRDYLLDAWLLRGMVQEEIATDTATPLPIRAVAPRRQPAFAKATAGRSWAVAAAVAGVCLIGGYVVGTRLPNLLGPVPVTPPPATVAAPPVTPASTPAPVRTSFPLPSPTRVIQLEFQTNSNVTAGG